MGVPGLFAWIRKRFSNVSSPLVRSKDGRYTTASPREDGTVQGLEVDNLYIGRC